MTLRLSSTDPGFAQAFDAFVQRPRGTPEDVDDVARRLLENVQQEGDAAVLRATAQLDRLQVNAVGDLRVPAEALEEAAAQIPSATMEALHLAAARIAAFHEAQKPRDLFWTDADGVRLGWRWTPIEAVGLYVPGGLAAYPSSVLMNALPARVAGVERIAMVVPSPDGVLNPLVLAAAHLAGVDEVWRIGGAQAVAALAYGTDTIAPVDKIVGPGNAYVAAAKRMVFGTVGIDTIAGPSEILVLADNGNDPAQIAMDLLSQAEHDPLAQSILITDDANFADAVAQAIETHLTALPRAAVARQSWENHGALVVVEDLLRDAPQLADRIAAEHLELAVADPDTLARKIRHAGAIFLGRSTPEALGDYVAGPNHVLPTDRTARFASGLGVLDFMKRTTLLGVSTQGLQAIGPAAVALAEAEGLHAHGRSVALRLHEPET